MVRMLLERMNTVDKNLIDLTNDYGDTALHSAAKNTTCQVIHELVNWGPNLFCQGGYYFSTALHRALDASDEPTRISNLRCLVEHANGYGTSGLNMQDRQGYTVLHKALRFADRNRSVIDYLSTKVDVSIQDVEGNTPLDIAVPCNHSDVLVQMLLRSRHATKAANTRNSRGRTPLHEAVLLKNANLVQVIGQIANVNVRDSYHGKSALHYAVTERATTCLDLLLMLNANVSVRDIYGITALARACIICDDDVNHAQTTMIFQLYKYGIAYGEVLNMI